MKSEYQYPLDLDWSVEDMVTVTDLWAKVEQAYESGIKAEDFLAAYAKFKQIVKSIGEEKRFGNQFEEASGYSLYRTVQAAKKLEKGRLKMEVEAQKYGKRRK
jgi:uncharacterized protein YktA (UPF0223 family)